MLKTLLLGSLAGLWFGSAAVAEMPLAPQPTAQFRHIDQPLWLKGTVTAGGVGLIGLELWWFLFRSRSHKADAN